MHQPFGKTGLAIPPIVFGTSSLGNLYQAVADDTCLEIVANWFRHVESPVFIDTAGKYGAGLALERIGRLLRKLEIAPQRVVISNKLGWLQTDLTTPEPTFEPGVWVGLQNDAVQDISYEGIMRCYEEGCRLLAPYRPTLVSVHDPDEYIQAGVDDADQARRWEDITGAYTALNELRAAGRVRGVGVGAKDWRFVEECDARFPLDWVMIANSLTVCSHPTDLIQYVQSLHERQIPVINSAVFNGGFLVGGDQYNYRTVSANTAEGQRLLQWREGFVAVCEEFDVLPAAACAAFARSPAGVVALALSSTRAARVESNVALAQAAMPGEFWDTLKDRELVDRGYPFV